MTRNMYDLRTAFFRNLDGLSVDAVKEVAWRHYYYRVLLDAIAEAAKRVLFEQSQAETALIDALAELDEFEDREDPWGVK